MACQGGEEKPMRDIASSSGYCYPDIQSHLVNQLQLQSFVSNPEIYNLNPGPGYDSTANWHDEVHNRLLADDSTVMIHGQRPTGQGLSLSLCSINPFELRQRQDAHMRFDSSTSRSDGFFSKSMNIQPAEDGFSGKSLNLYQYGNFHISNSKYLGPAQELLMEFCNLGTKEEVGGLKLKTQKAHKTDQWQLQVDDQRASSSSGRSTLELLELQKRKAKLLSMLEELDGRYRNYCEQMKAVISSFEAVAGEGAARVYSELASKAMSRHFRNLRDGIVGQIKAAKMALGEKDVASLGMTRGETPRLRLLDQSLRQQRAFQQMNMESHPWRPQRGLPERSVCVLRAWLFEHFLHPYPSDVDKHILSRQTGLSRSQVANWFINARVRLWKPMVEEMYLEETKENDNMASSDDNGQPEDDQNYPPPQGPSEDQKPSREQLVRIDYESLSSLINHPEKNESSHTKSPQNHNYGFCRVGDTFGAVELDFSAYNQNYGGTGTSGGGTSNGGGVSLTLGLQQHGASLPVFYGRGDHMEEDCQPVQYSLLDGEGQNLPYRNLMGAQLLRDLDLAG